MKSIRTGTLALCLLLLFAQCGKEPDFDIIIRGGTIYDGTGSSPFIGDIAINADTIVAVGKITRGSGRREILASGLSVSPGFINMLSWANETLIIDGKSESNIRQGVTLEVFGEGWSEGPLNEAMRTEALRTQGDLKYDIPWTTVGEYLEHLVRKGVSPNVASFVGATTVRINVLGEDDRAPSPEELERMKSLVREAMEEGALGVGSSLIYAPAFYATTEELIALCKVAAEYNGMYTSHIRSEGNRFLEALDEFLKIASEADIRSEVYHLKAAGKSNWHKLDAAIAKIEAARAWGMEITTDMYTYTAGQTGLNAAMPPWVQEGGLQQWIGRLKDPAIRTRVAKEMRTPTDKWENLYLAAGSAENVLLVGFKSEKLKPLTGKTLAAVAAMRGKSPEETAMDLVAEDESWVATVYFLMSEENIKKKIALPFMSFGSDAASMAPEGVFLKANPHPRAYGNFARLLGKYVRDEGVIRIEEAIRRLTSFPAKNLRIEKRGVLETGAYADIAIFDEESIRELATYENPHQYAKGMKYVLVNGVVVLDDGDHTGAKPGRVVRGPGYKKKMP